MAQNVSFFKRTLPFLGCAGYYRHFVQNFAKIPHPCTTWEKKETVFHWTRQSQEAFDTLKHRLTNPPILAYPRFDLPFIVDRDASDTGLGAVLSQIQDHMWLRSFKEPKGQVARWIKRLAEFDFTIEHRPGRLHGNADALSRSLHQLEPNFLTNKATGLENPPPITCSTAENQKQQSWLAI